MYHPLWEDVGGSISAEKGVQRKDRYDKASPTCPECGHSRVVHRLNGACYGESHCLCGWTRGMNGELRVKRTDESAGDVSTKRKNKGARISNSRRADLLKIPCYFCGDRDPRTIDHMLARSRGGRSDDGNLVSACELCNSMKGDKTYDEFIVFVESLETAVNRKTSLRSVVRFIRWKEQAKKILAWHTKRISARRAPVP